MGWGEALAGGGSGVSDFFNNKSKFKFFFLAGRDGGLGAKGGGGQSK